MPNNIFFTKLKKPHKVAFFFYKHLLTEIKKNSKYYNTAKQNKRVYFRLV